MALCGLLAAHWQDPLTKFERRWYWLLKTMAVYSKKGLILRNSEALFRSLEEQATQDSFYTCTVWQRRSYCGGDWREGVGAPCEMRWSDAFPTSLGEHSAGNHCVLRACEWIVRNGGDELATSL